MNSETANLIELVTNKRPNYTSAYELFPQFLFRKRKTPTVDPATVPEKVYTQRFDLEDFPELGPTSYEHHPMMYPRFYYNTTVYLGEKEPVEQPIQVPVQPEPVQMVPEQVPKVEPVLTLGEKVQGGQNLQPPQQMVTLAEPQTSLGEPVAQLSARIAELEASLHSWRSKAEQYALERDPAIVQREREEQLAREQRAREEAEERIREAERIERERIETLRREEEEKRLRKEQEKERLRREREEYYKTYDFSGHHFRYYKLSKMDEVNLFQMYKFACSDPGLSSWRSSIREELYGRFDWRLQVGFPKIRPQIQLLCNKKYAELGSIHRLIGQIAKQKRHFVAHGYFPEHQSQAMRIKGIEAYFNF